VFVVSFVVYKEEIVRKRGNYESQSSEKSEIPSYRSCVSSICQRFCQSILGRIVYLSVNFRSYRVQRADLWNRDVDGLCTVSGTELCVKILLNNIKVLYKIADALRLLINVRTDSL
jgi:hypothetical protein